MTKTLTGYDVMVVCYGTPLQVKCYQFFFEMCHIIEVQCDHYFMLSTGHGVIEYELDCRLEKTWLAGSNRSNSYQHVSNPVKLLLYHHTLAPSVLITPHST